MQIKNKTYLYDIPVVGFGKVFASNVRKAKTLVRTIFKMRALPPKSQVWAA